MRRTDRVASQDDSGDETILFMQGPRARANAINLWTDSDSDSDLDMFSEQLRKDSEHPARPRAHAMSVAESYLAQQVAGRPTTNAMHYEEPQLAGDRIWPQTPGSDAVRPRANAMSAEEESRQWYAREWNTWRLYFADASVEAAQTFHTWHAERPPLLKDILQAGVLVPTAAYAGIALLAHTIKETNAGRFPRQQRAA